MRSFCAPSDLSPEQRRHEIARILAVGVLRLRKLRVIGEPADPPRELSGESGTGGLEVSDDTVLSVTTG